MNVVIWKTNEILRKTILAFILEVIVFGFLIENYGTLLLTWHHSEINPTWLFPSAFLFVHSRNVHKAVDLLYEYDSVEERVKKRRNISCENRRYLGKCQYLCHSLHSHHFLKGNVYTR